MDEDYRDEVHQSWINHELEVSRLPDRRLARRMGLILDCLAASPGVPVPAACQE
jgi:hypothetical protein